MSTASIFVVGSFLALAVFIALGKAINASVKWPKTNGARIAFWCLLAAMIVIPVGLLGYFELFHPSDDLDLAYARGGLAGEISSAILPAVIAAWIFSFMFSRRYGKKRVSPAARSEKAQAQPG